MQLIIDPHRPLHILEVSSLVNSFHSDSGGGTLNWLRGSYFWILRYFLLILRVDVHDINLIAQLVHLVLCNPLLVSVHIVPI